MMTEPAKTQGGGWTLNILNTLTKFLVLRNLAFDVILLRVCA